MLSPVIILQLTRAKDGSIHVLTIKSPSGLPTGSFLPPFSQLHQREAVALALEAVQFDHPRWETEVPDKLQALNDLDLSDKHGLKTDLAERVGIALYTALFPPGDLREALHAALNAGNSTVPPRVELRFSANATDLGALPWELLYDESRGFLFAGRRAALVRYITYNQPLSPLLPVNTLNVLLVTARPVDPTLPLLPDAESQAIETGLAEPISQGRVRMVQLPPASPAQSTWELLNEHLIKSSGNDTPHIFHFDGHGGFGRHCLNCGMLNSAGAPTCIVCQHHLDGDAQGYLAFERRDKRPDWVSAQQLGNLLTGIGVRLAVLTACKSAVMAGESVFSGIAPALIQAGVPGIVAMQFSVTAGAAMQFAKFFYLAISQRVPLTQAVGQTRAALLVDAKSWYRPVLYLRTDDTNPEGQLFREGDESEGEPVTQIFQLLAKAPPPLSQHLRLNEFRTIVDEQTKDFVGRDFIFKQIDKWLQDPNFPSGYIVITGEPGIGKTSILAQLIRQKNYVHHFNRRLENIRSSQKFLRNICAQLIVRYKLNHKSIPQEKTEDSGFLSQLLAEAVAIQEQRPIVVVVDALDESDDLGLSSGANCLYLPFDLPKDVFFIVTTRPKDNIRLSAHRQRDIYLDEKDPANLEDLRQYINNFLQQNSAKMTELLSKWAVDEKEFVNVLIDKSEGNFMYLHYVLSDIRDSDISNRGPSVTSIGSLNELPVGLRGYYARHWRLMREQAPEHFEKYYEPVICHLAAAREPVSVDKVAEWTQLKPFHINEVIRTWREFLNEEPGTKLYRLYHTSFQEFLREDVGLKKFHRSIAQTILAKVWPQK